MHLLRASGFNFFEYEDLCRNRHVHNICLLLSLFCSRFRVEAVLISEGALKIHQIIQPFLFVFVEESHFIRGCTKQKQTSGNFGTILPHLLPIPPNPHREGIFQGSEGEKPTVQRMDPQL